MDLARAALVAGGGAAAAVLNGASLTGDTRRQDLDAARRRVGAVPSEHRVQTGDGSLHVAEWGRGRPVLLLHGLTGSHGDWLPVVRRLVTAGRRVLALDLPGHGQSSRVCRPVGVHRLAEDVRVVVEHLDLRDAVLAGHSLGGTALLALAARFPRETRQRVRRVVTLGATPALRRLPELGTLAFAANPASPLLLHGRATGRTAMRLNVFGPDAPDDVVDEVRVRWARCPLATRWAYATGTIGEDLRHRLPAVPIPVTAVNGDRDRMCPPSRARAIADGVPCGEVRLLAGAGHQLPQERPEEVTAILLDAA